MLTKLKEKSMKFDSLIIQYSAPSICGIKPSNLFSVSKAAAEPLQINLSPDEEGIAQCKAWAASAIK